MKTDKGLRQAVRQQAEFRLPSNFGYRMMQKINQEAYLNEKRKERRSYLLLSIFSLLTTGICIVFIGWRYRNELASILHTLKGNLPEYSTISFYLPMLLALPLLYLFNRWLKRTLR